MNGRDSGDSAGSGEQSTARQGARSCYEGGMKLLTLAGSVLAVAATAVAGGLATDPDSKY